MSDLRQIALPGGLRLAVRMEGQGEPVILLHGFPESHRTWRSIIPDLARDHFVVAPDQRGFAGSDKPDGLEAYKTDRLVQDVFDLADSLGLDRFTLVGHDWGGAVAWLAALRDPGRVARLVIVNAPHPLVFQRSLIEDPAQREASQYIRAFRNPLLEAAIAAMGYEAFFDRTMGGHADLTHFPDEEKAAYVADWSQPGAMTSMLAWYRASEMTVPEPGEKASLPVWISLPFPTIMSPTLVVWGMKDVALLPVQLEGLDELVDDLRIVKVADAGHFVTWEKPEAVIAAMRDFFLECPLAEGPAPSL